MKKIDFLIPAFIFCSCASHPASHPPVASPPIVAPAKTSTAPPAAPIPTAADLVDHSGDSVETAVTVPPDVPDEAHFENEWMFDRYGRFRRRDFGISHQLDRHYDLITIELPDGSRRVVYFDITDLWNSWKPE